MTDNSKVTNDPDETTRIEAGSAANDADETTRIETDADDSQLDETTLLDAATDKTVVMETASADSEAPTQQLAAASPGDADAGAAGSNGSETQSADAFPASPDSAEDAHAAGRPAQESANSEALASDGSETESASEASASDGSETQSATQSDPSTPAADSAAPTAEPEASDIEAMDASLDDSDLPEPNFDPAATPSAFDPRVTGEAGFGAPDPMASVPNLASADAGSGTGTQAGANTNTDEEAAASSSSNAAAGARPYPTSAPQSAQQWAYRSGAQQTGPNQYGMNQPGARPASQESGQQLGMAPARPQSQDYYATPSQWRGRDEAAASSSMYAGTQNAGTPNAGPGAFQGASGYSPQQPDRPHQGETSPTRPHQSQISPNLTHQGQPTPNLPTPNGPRPGEAGSSQQSKRGASSDNPFEGVDELSPLPRSYDEEKSGDHHPVKFGLLTWALVLVFIGVMVFAMPWWHLIDWPVLGTTALALMGAIMLVTAVLASRREKKSKKR